MPKLDKENEIRFKKYLYNEVTLVIAIIGVVWSVFNYINNPQKYIEAEFSKHEALGQQYNEGIAKELQIIREGDLKDLKADLLENRDEIRSLAKEIVRLQTIIEERFPKK